VKTRSPLLLAVAAALISAPSAAGKFSISLAVEPTPLWAKQPARVTIRTGTALPPKHGMRLFAVGPWRDKYGVASFEIRLIRTGPAALKATVRFPHGGRWQLIVPNVAGRAVRVRPST
jgi:hypothetical protein